MSPFQILLGFSPNRVPENLRPLVKLAAQALGVNVIAKRRLQRPRKTLRETVRKAGSTAYAKRLILWAADRYDLALPKLAIKFREIPSAGLIQRRGGIWYIDLHHDLSRDDDRLASTIAHELAHVVLAQAGITLEPVLQNERLTDCTAVLAGFGSLMLRSQERRTEVRTFLSTVVHITTTGYLTAQELQSMIRLQRAIASRKQRNRRTPVDIDRTGVLPCSGCGVRLALPRRPARIRITCPVCGLIQVLSLSAGPVGPAAVTRVMNAFLDQWNGF